MKITRTTIPPPPPPPPQYKIIIELDTTETMKLYWHLKAQLDRCGDVWLREFVARLYDKAV